MVNHHCESSELSLRPSPCPLPQAGEGVTLFLLRQRTPSPACGRGQGEGPLLTITKRKYSLLTTLFFIIFLTSCSHLHKKDGPPNFYVDETKVPNAVPKPEPLAKFGNMSSYRVFGKRYYVMKSSKHYDQVGIASWYGTQFHSHKTSSGEPYNMLSMTAAHKTLPLPTYVQVTNLRNHRKIIVKVNDRGPFANGRIIDLSYVAAKKLGMIGHGTTMVRVTAIDPHTFGRKRLYFNN